MKPEEGSVRSPRGDRWSWDLAVSQAGLLGKYTLTSTFMGETLTPYSNYSNIPSLPARLRTHKWVHDPPSLSCSIFFSCAAKALEGFTMLLGKCPAASRKPWDIPLSLQSTFLLPINEAEPEEEPTKGKRRHTSTLTSPLAAHSAEWADILPSSQNHRNLCFFCYLWLLKHYG